MNIFTELQNILTGVITTLQKDGVLPAQLDLGNVRVEPPKDSNHGHVSTNAALILAGHAKMPPRELATKIAENLADQPDIAAVDVAGPGFVNITLDAGKFHRVAKSILTHGKDFMRSNQGANIPVNVEYVSANPTGPLHVGHARGAVFGDVLANLLEKVGYQVTREYYINDAGGQIDILARSVYLRYCEVLGDTVTIPEGLYPGTYLIPVAQALADKYGDRFHGQDASAWLEVIKPFVVAAMLRLIKEDLALLGIKHDVFSSEKALRDDGRVADALAQLATSDNVYTGVLDPPKGKKAKDWEARPQTLFRAKNWGDDTDRTLKKSDGSLTYFASDIAYHLDKFQRGFRQMINIFGAEHGGYVKRMVAATRAVTNDQAHLDIKICQLVKLLEDGKTVKMSKRAGSFITLHDLVADVGKDVVRFIMLTRKNDAPLDFDATLVKQQSRDNPIFYVQYAHARCHSVQKAAQMAFPDHDFSPSAAGIADFSSLDDPAQLEALYKLAIMPRLVELAAESREPHRIAFYLLEVAAIFHALWNKGKSATHLRFVHADDWNRTQAHLALITCFQIVIAAGLDILGIAPILELK